MNTQWSGECLGSYSTKFHEFITLDINNLQEIHLKINASLVEIHDSQFPINVIVS
jgi:hypothetical protein